MSTAPRQSSPNFDVVDGFFKRPRRWTFVEVTDVDVDKDDNVYVFSRGPHCLMIFDKLGNFLDAWGEISATGFIMPHALTVGPDKAVYTVDCRNHTVCKWTAAGKLLLRIGTPFSHAPAHSGAPFNRPTGVSVASNGDIYVSDGYANSHVHCFDPSGLLKFSWGGRGDRPGQFETIHGIFVDRDTSDTVYCADRNNDRIQIFTPTGEFLGQWSGLQMPNCVRKGPDGNFYIAELYHRVTVLSPKGEVLAQWGDNGETRNTRSQGPERSLRAGAESRRDAIRNEPGPGLFSAAHGIAVDSEGSVYVADAAESFAGLDRGDRCIQKFVRV